MAPTLVQERDRLARQCEPQRAPRIAALMAGGARTMTSPGAVDDISAFFRWLRPRAREVRLFAYIDLKPRYAYQVTRLHASGSLPRAAAAADVRRAVDAFGVAHELQFHNATALPEPSERPYGQAWCCAPPGPSTGQGVKLGAAVAMLARHERRSAEAPYDVVVRLRPDACLMVGLPFFAFALARTSCASLVRFELKDVVAVAPRALADALPRVAATGEGGGSSWCGHRGLAFDMRSGPYGGFIGGAPGEVMLRRPARNGSGGVCSTWT